MQFRTQRETAKLTRRVSCRLAMAQTWQWVRGLPGPGAIPGLIRKQLEKLPGPLGEMMPEAFDAAVGEVGERTGWRMPGDYYYGVPGGPSGALERILGAQTVGEMMDYVAAETQGLLRHLPGGALSEGSAALALLAAAGIVMVTGGAALAVFGPGAVLAAAGVGFVTGAASGAVGQLVQDLSTGTWSDVEEYLGPGGWERLQEDLATVEWSSREMYGKQMLLGGIGGAVAGVVGMGASALGLSPLAGGALSGLSVGATQQFAANLVEGQSWHAGVMQSALVGGIGGAVAGGVVGAVNPQSLGARVALGALVGGGVSGGTQVAFNVMGGRPWNEGLGQAVTIGATTGAVDAFTDFYGDKVMDRVMRPRARGADDGADMLFRPRGAEGERGSASVETATFGLARLLAPDTGAGGGAPRRVGDGPEGVGRRADALAVDSFDEMDIFPASAERVSDLGSGGSGYDLRTLGDLGLRYPDADVTGYDILHPILDDVARVIGREAAISRLVPEYDAMIRDLPENTSLVIGDYGSEDVAPSSSSDLVTVFAPEPSNIDNAAKQAARVAEPGGRIVMTVRHEDLLPREFFVGDPPIMEQGRTRRINEVRSILEQNTGGTVRVFSKVPVPEIAKHSYAGQKRESSGYVTIFVVQKR